MEQIKPLKSTSRQNIFGLISAFVLKLSDFLGVVVLITLYSLIFLKTKFLNGYAQDEIITYILIGNIIGLTTSYFLHRLISSDLKNNDSKLLIYKPIKYLRTLLAKGLGRNIFPFLATLFLNLALLYLFIGNIPLNLEIHYLTTIFLMLVLAFIIEFLLAYLTRFFTFWAIESKKEYAILLRIKKFLAGSYFPLTLLPASLLNISLFMPFAYSFFVPTQLYLKKINIAIGLRGLLTQIIWILILYSAIYFLWWKKEKSIAENQNNIAFKNEV